MSTDRSIEGYQKFLTYLSNKGLVKPSKVANWKSASSVVLKILDDTETQDLTALDFDDVFKRFINLKGQGYTPHSIATYRSRTVTPLEEFAAYVSDPGGYRPNSISKEPKTASSGTVSPRKAAKKSVGKTEEKSPTGQLLLPPPPGIVTTMVPIPLRPGLVVQVQNLPTDLTAQEAKKITAIISAYGNGDSA